MFDVFIDISDLTWGNFDTIVALHDTKAAFYDSYKILMLRDKGFQIWISVNTRMGYQPFDQTADMHIQTDACRIG